MFVLYIDRVNLRNLESVENKNLKTSLGKIYFKYIGCCCTTAYGDKLVFFNNVSTLLKYYLSQLYIYIIIEVNYIF